MGSFTPRQTERRQTHASRHTAETSICLEKPRMPSIRTRSLEIFYEEGGPPHGSPVLLLHGWPDTARGWKPVAQHLQSKGYRTIAPYLRGTVPTRFLTESTPRFAGGVALAQDAIDLADALN